MLSEVDAMRGCSHEHEPHLALADRRPAHIERTVHQARRKHRLADVPVLWRKSRIVVPFAQLASRSVGCRILPSYARSVNAGAR
jgi:hypothetical protein